MKDYKNVIATLKKEGAVEVKNLTIKSVKFNEKEDITKMALTLDGNVPAYVSKDDGVTFEKSENNVIWVFPSVIKALLRDMPDYAAIRDYLVADEKIAKMALVGCKIDVLACEVAGDEIYKNPFSDSDAEGAPIGHDTIVHHVVKLVESKNLAKVATRLEDKILDAALGNL